MDSKKVKTPRHLWGKTEQNKLKSVWTQVTQFNAQNDGYSKHLHVQIKFSRYCTFLARSTWSSTWFAANVSHEVVQWFRHLLRRFFFFLFAKKFAESRLLWGSVCLEQECKYIIRAVDSLGNPGKNYFGLKHLSKIGEWFPKDDTGARQIRRYPLWATGARSDHKMFVTRNSSEHIKRALIDRKRI